MHVHEALDETPASTQIEALEAATMRRVTLRFMPLILLAYIICYLDRVNVGYAALTANRELGLTPTLYGWGAGIFFLSYFIFEYPSNVVMQRVGARIWITRIMISWGLLSAGMALVTGPVSFFVARFLLGAAEAGFFPGIMLFMTLWFPRRYRARCIGFFMLGNPISSLIGGVISGSILNLDGFLGIKGWQWLYVLEAVPAVLLGFITWRVLTDKPEQSTWLEPRQRDWLCARLASEAAEQVSDKNIGFFRTLLDRKVLFYSAVFFNVTAASYSLSLWLPQIIKNASLTNTETGFISALPFLVGTIAMVVWARRSDRLGERLWHTSICALVIAIGLAASAFAHSPAWQIAAISFAALGIFGIKGPFLAMTTEAFSGPGAAGRLATVSALGNLCGFLPPLVIGWLRTATGSFTPGLIMLAVLAAIGAWQVWAVSRKQAAGMRTA